MRYIDGSRCACGHEPPLHQAQGCTGWRTVNGAPVKCDCKGFVVTLETGAAASIIRVLGELDLVSSPQLARAIANVAPGKPRVIIVDFTECRYIDSSVLTVLIRSNKLPETSLRLVVPGGAPIRRTFAVTSLDTIMRINATIEEASG